MSVTPACQVIGQFLEAVDQNTGIVGSTTGSNYYVRSASVFMTICLSVSLFVSLFVRYVVDLLFPRILSTIDRELLKPSASVALHKHSNALVDVLPPEVQNKYSYKYKYKYKL